MYLKQKLKKKEQELIAKLQIEFMESMYEKYLKVSKKTSSEFTMLDFMAHAKRSNVDLVSEERLNELRAKENKLHELLQSQQQIHNQGGNVTNMPTGE